MEVADASTGIIDSPLERYELAELLGQGGSSSIYRAFYIVQQLAPGKPLTEWVQSGWRGTEAEVKDIARQMYPQRRL